MHIATLAKKLHAYEHGPAAKGGDGIFAGAAASYEDSKEDKFPVLLLFLVY